jgi:hypothetical protein
MRAGLTTGQALVNKLNKGDTRIMATLEELNKLKNDLDFHIHQAATSEQRKQVLALELV